MPDGNNRTTETELAKVILEILYKHSKGEMRVRDLIREIPKRIDLTEEDQQQSETRGNEEIWEQRVRNIQSHHDVPGNYIHEGFLEHVKGGLRITEAGRKRYEHTH
jgi:hypothetical protein